MGLQSNLFRDSQRLNECLVSHSAHVVEGSEGEHVRLIQRALVWLGSKEIAGREYLDGRYGKTTANAVLDYKKQRGVINYSYQSQADNIVGKMTIASLDQEVRRVERLRAASTNLGLESS